MWPYYPQDSACSSYSPELGKSLEQSLEDLQPRSGTRSYIPYIHIDTHICAFICSYGMCNIRVYDILYTHETCVYTHIDMYIIYNIQLNE